MSQINITLQEGSTHSESQMKSLGAQGKRKALIVKVNPKTLKIFDNIDFDYSELFTQLAIFSPDSIGTCSADNIEEKKRKFLVDNYQRILIHFFQFLFDFELETLQFQEKHQTILSFAEWLEDEVVFSFPDKINLLNKKKEESKKKEIQKTKLQTTHLIEVESLKRSFDLMVHQQEQKIIEEIQSPKKKKVAQNQEKEVCLVDFSPKYDEVTNHTAFDTPKISNGQSEISDDRNEVAVKNVQKNQPAKKQNPNKRKIVKVNFKQTKQLTNQFSQKDDYSQNTPKDDSKSKKKLTYRLKQNYKQKKQKGVNKGEKSKNKEALGKKVESKSPIKERRKQNNQSLAQNKIQIIILDSSGEVKQNEQNCSCEQGLGQIQDIGVLEGLQLCNLQKNVDEMEIRSEVSNSKKDSVASRQSPQLFQSQPIQSFPQKSFPSVPLNPHLNPKDSEQSSVSDSSHFERLKQIVQDIKISCQKENKQEHQKLLKERQDRKLHNFRSRLSGLFRYPQKRYYIFPDMVDGWDKEDENRRGMQVRRMSKSKSMKKDKLNEKSGI